MKVILQQDVKDVGKVGELVNVSPGFARNFLFPRNLAAEATEKRVKEFKHLKQMAEMRQKKVVADRKSLVEKLSDRTVSFKSKAGDTEKLFGSITTIDVSNELEKLGFSVDRRDIVLPEPIKVLGQHRAIVKLGEGIEAELKVMVEKE